VKPFFNIPALVDHGISKHIRVSEDAPKKSFMEGFRESKLFLKLDHFSDYFTMNIHLLILKFVKKF